MRLPASARGGSADPDRPDARAHRQSDRRPGALIRAGRAATALNKIESGV
jgi:hypothetical protein